MKRYNLDHDGMIEDPEGTYVKHNDVKCPHVDIHPWEQWAKEVCADFKIEYDNHPVGLRLAITKWMVNSLPNAEYIRAESNL